MHDVLAKHNWEVEDFTENAEDPYIFVKAPKDQSVSFEGVRVYKIGKTLAFRVQNESETHPYGKAYMLDIEGMFNDLMSDAMDEEKSGNSVMSGIDEELKRFFKHSAEAEKELNKSDIDDKESLGKVMVRSTGTDYSNIVHSKT